AVDAAEPRIAGAFRDQPGVEAYVRDSLGVTYRHLGEPGLAIRQQQRAVELRKAALGPDHPDPLATQHNLAPPYKDASPAARTIWRSPCTNGRWRHKRPRSAPTTRTSSPSRTTSRWRTGRTGGWTGRSPCSSGR